jgi:hypothetical protein
MIMKRIAYISIVLFAFGMASCSKQDIQPNGANTTTEPVWRSSSDDPIVIGGSEEGGGEGTITDPNNEGDASKSSTAN